MTDKEQKKRYEEKWGENEEPGETPTERPHCDNDSLKNQDKEQIMIDGCNVLKCRYYQYKTLKDCEMRYPESGDCFNGNLDMEKLCVDNPNCYFKQLARKTQLSIKQSKELIRLRKELQESTVKNRNLKQECEELNNEIIDMNSIIEDAAINLGNKDFTLYDLPFEIKKLSQECENLKAEEKYLKQCCQKAGEELAKHSFEYDGKEKNLVVQAIELNEKYEKFKKALEEIEEVIDSIFDRCPWRKTDSCMPVYNVCEELIKTLDIINKAKGETNA